MAFVFERITNKHNTTHHTNKSTAAEAAKTLTILSFHWVQNSSMLLLKMLPFNCPFRNMRFFFQLAFWLRGCYHSDASVCIRTTLLRCLQNKQESMCASNNRKLCRFSWRWMLVCVFAYEIMCWTALVNAICQMSSFFSKKQRNKCRKVGKQSINHLNYTKRLVLRIRIEILYD